MCALYKYVCANVFAAAASACCSAPAHSSFIIIQLANRIYEAGYVGTSFNG